MIALPVHYPTWTQRVDRVSAELKANHRGARFNGKFEVWTTGTVPARARQELGQRGYAVTERVGSRVEIQD